MSIVVRALRLSKALGRHLRLNRASTDSSKGFRRRSCRGGFPPVQSEPQTRRLEECNLQPVCSAECLESTKNGARNAPAAKADSHWRFRPRPPHLCSNGYSRRCWVALKDAPVLSRVPSSHFAFANRRPTGSTSSLRFFECSPFCMAACAICAFSLEKPHKSRAKNDPAS